MNEYQLARNLGVFSLGLGLAELLVPRQVARLIGIGEEHEKTLQLLGLREIASAVGIMQGKPSYFLWSRVAGDIMDLGLLSAALNSDRSDRRRVEGALAAVAAVTVVDIIASALHTRNFVEPGWRDERPVSDRAGISREHLPRSRGNANGDTSEYPATLVT
jgi:hypothetical protein